MIYLAASLLSLLFFMPLAIANATGLSSAMEQSAAGMKAQGMRMSIVAQNIANESSIGDTPGAQPYRRKTIAFKNKKDKKSDVELVTVSKLGRDYKNPFKATFDPTSPAADENGYVLLPNVSTAIEQVDMKEAQRSYEANMGVMQTSKRMYQDTIDLLK
jgi:flagellar basal-body rod protein FlgC